VSLADQFLARQQAHVATHLLGVKQMLVWPLQHPQPFDPADHERRQAAHDDLVARMTTDQED
jgi:hypothetical protein